MQAYQWSDKVLFPLLYHVVRYRRRVVRENIAYSFPDKSEAERQAIERKFYHHLADVAVEIVYGYKRTREEMREHIVFEDGEGLARLAQERGGCICMIGHMGCWEWFPACQRHFDELGVVAGSVYRRQKNKRIDALLLRMRLHHGGICIEKQRLLRELIRMRRDGEKVVLGLIADQKPRPEVTKHYTEFLHQRTGWLDGGEVLAKKFDYPVVYAHIACTARGQYKVKFETLSLQPKETAEGEITRLYAEALERNIQEQPEQWLWTHKRWKWTR